MNLLNRELPNTEKTKFTKKSLQRKPGKIKASKIAILTVKKSHSPSHSATNDTREKAQYQTAYLNNSLHLWSYRYHNSLHFAKGPFNSRFSPVMWSKLTIVTVPWIKSRIWDTIDDWYINNIAKNQVFAVFHSRVICISVPPKFIELCMETPCLCPSEENK